MCVYVLTYKSIRRRRKKNCANRHLLCKRFVSFYLRHRKGKRDQGGLDSIQRSRSLSNETSAHFAATGTRTNLQGTIQPEARDSSIYTLICLRQRKRIDLYLYHTSSATRRVEKTLLFTRLPATRMYVLYGLARTTLVSSAGKRKGWWNRGVGG